jgi:hypothetical protein
MTNVQLCVLFLDRKMSKRECTNTVRPYIHGIKFRAQNFKLGIVDAYMANLPDTNLHTEAIAYALMFCANVLLNRFKTHRVMRKHYTFQRCM